MSTSLISQNPSTSIPPDDSAAPTWLQFSLLLLLLVLQRLLVPNSADTSYSKTPQMDTKSVSTQMYFTTKYHLTATPGTVIHTAN